MNQKSEHAKLVLNPFVIYIASGLIAVLLQRLIPLPFISGHAAQIAGAAMLLVNLIIGLPAVRGMLKAKTSPNPSHPTAALVLSGPYRFTRNPMYIGLTLMYAGLMTFFQLAWGLLLTPLVIWLITIWVIRPEEEYLERKFGSEYIQYKQSVRRWI